MAEPLSDKQKKCIYARAYRAANREKLKQQWQAHAAANPQARKDKDAKYYAANREKILEKKHEDYLSRGESPEYKTKQAEQGKAYRQKHPGYLKAYYAANREQLKQKQRERYLRYRDLPEFKAKKAEGAKLYAAANRVKLSEKRRAHHDKNRERDNAKNREWYAANREYRSAQIKVYGAEHAEEAKVRSDEWYRNNRARKYAKNRAWAVAHPQEVRAFWQKRYALEKNAPGSFGADDLRQLFEQQEGCCHYCDVYLTKGFEMDHYIPLSLGGTNEASNIVLACMPCNRSKGNKLPAVFMRGLGRKQGLSLRRVAR
jgi:5-methylcytosine-specific restriction endonuclease McrA